MTYYYKTLNEMLDFLGGLVHECKQLFLSDVSDGSIGSVFCRRKAE